MNPLEKRLVKLEPTSSKNQVRVILIKPIEADNGKPANPQPRITAARLMSTGEIFAHRHDGEDEEGFQKRACDLAEELYAGVSLITLVSDQYLPAERNNHGTA